MKSLSRVELYLGEQRALAESEVSAKYRISRALSKGTPTNSRFCNARGAKSERLDGGAVENNVLATPKAFL